MKNTLLYFLILFTASHIVAQEPNAEDAAPLKLSVNRKLYVVAYSGFSENSYLLTAGMQASKLFSLNYRDKNVINFHIDLAGIGFRKQYQSGNTRPGAFLTASLYAKIFESISGKSVFNAVNMTIMDYGLNQFKSDGFSEDHAMHFEVSNLTAIAYTQYLFRRDKVKITLTPGFKLSNLENPQFGYIVSCISSIANHLLFFVKLDNTTTIGHRLSAGLMYWL